MSDEDHQSRILLSEAHRIEMLERVVAAESAVAEVRRSLERLEKKFDEEMLSVLENVNAKSREIVEVSMILSGKNHTNGLCGRVDKLAIALDHSDERFLDMIERIEESVRSSRVASLERQKEHADASEKRHAQTRKWILGLITAICLTSIGLAVRAVLTP